MNNPHRRLFLGRSLSGAAKVAAAGLLLPTAGRAQQVTWPSGPGVRLELGLAQGDEVVTAGGLLGRVTKVAESFVSLEVSSGVEVQCQRSAVVQVLPKGSIK